MRAQFGVALLSLALLPIAAACDSDPAGPAEDQPFLQATVQGAVQSGFNGTGEFYVTSNLRLSGVTEFALNSEGQGESAGERFILFRRGAGVPAVGTYSIGTIDMLDASAQGFTGIFLTAGDMVQYFTSSSGQLVITHSSPEVVRGTFTFSAFRYCVADQRTGSTFGPCSVPPNPLSGAPTITVNGSFVAHLMDPTVSPLN